MAAQTLPQIDRLSFLRRVLQADGVFCALSGLLLLVDSGPIAMLIGASQPWVLMMLGVDLLIYAALLFLAARRTPTVRWHVIAFLVADGAWVLASLALVLGGLLSLTTFGFWAVLGVADVVAVLGVLKYVGLRRSAVLSAEF
jgi:hypothetical protein